MHTKPRLSAPASLLARPLRQQGVETVILDACTRDYVASATGIDHYSARALARVWKAERFSWWLTGITQRFPAMDGFAGKMQVAELSSLRGSRAAPSTLAENYDGLPLQ